MKTYEKEVYTVKLANMIKAETGTCFLEVVDRHNGFIRACHNTHTVDIQYIGQGVFVIDPLMTSSQVASKPYAMDTSAIWYSRLTLALSKINIASHKAYITVNGELAQ